MAVHDPAGGVVDHLDAPGSAPAHQKAPQQRQGQGDAHAPVNGRLYHPFEVGQVVHVPAHQQPQPSLNLEDAGPGQTLGAGPAHRFVEGEVDPAGFGSTTVIRPGFQVTGQFQGIVGGEQVDGLGVRIPGHPFADDGDQPVHAATTILLRQTGDFRFDGLVGLGGHETGGAPVDEGQQNEHGGGEHHHVQQC